MKYNCKNIRKISKNNNLRYKKNCNNNSFNNKTNYAVYSK